MLRFIHTSDWHLGRIFYGVQLTDDQAYVLEQFVKLILDVKPDAVLISGDIYDRAVPPPIAVKLLNEVLSSIITDINVPVVMISGNHDSGERLGFGSRLLSKQGLFIFSDYTNQMMPVLIMDREWGLSARIYALPYGDPSTIREYLGNDAISDHETALSAMIHSIINNRPPDEYAVCVSHAFIAGSTVSESERPLSVGGASAVNASIFKDFDYTAMGHLHRPQSAGFDTIQYAGSLLKYSFSEAGHTKSVNLVEMDDRGMSRLERIPLVPRRDVRICEGYLKDVLKGPGAGESREDYLMVRLLDRGAILDAMGKIREVYPNCLHIERPPLTNENADGARVADHTRMTDVELFTSFFEQTTGEDFSQEQSAAFAAVADEVGQSEREAPR